MKDLENMESVGTWGVLSIDGNDFGYLIQKGNDINTIILMNSEMDKLNPIDDVKLFKRLEKNNDLFFDNKTERGYWSEIEIDGIRYQHIEERKGDKVIIYDVDFVKVSDDLKKEIMELVNEYQS